MADPTRDDSLVRIALVLVALFVLVPLLVMVVMAPMMGLGMMGFHWGGAVPGVLELFVLLFVLLPPLLFVVLVVVAWRYLSDRDGGDRDDPALHELRMALARGDITEDEFEDRRRLLDRERQGQDD